MKKEKWPEGARGVIAAPGLKYIGMAGVITGLIFWFGGIVAGGVALLPFLFVCWFFRDPERQIPLGEDAIVSPADGRVIRITPLPACDVMSDPCIRVSIFMNVFNVHVNRVPLSGVVEKATYHPGKFFNASLDKASEHNERNSLVIKTPSGALYGVVQIAGLIARRIVCRVKPGDTLERGHRYGMICFGSRLDVYLPPDTDIAVTIGQKVSAGASVVGKLSKKTHDSLRDE